MDSKEKQHVAIKFCFETDSSAIKTLEIMEKIYGEKVLN